jgi:glycosyltransferase involved in cell wall biosynthesis
MSARVAREPLVLVFVVLTAAHPVGGALSRYQRANTLASRGHVVHVVHIYKALSSANEPDGPPGWFSFDDNIRHHLGFDSLPCDFRADVALGVSRRGILPPSLGLPVTLLQGLSPVDPDEDCWIVEAEGPIACTSTWLVETCTARGVPPHRVRLIPDGVDPTTFRVLESPSDRPPRVAFLCHPMPAKGSRDSVTVLEVAKGEVPDLEAVAFGVHPRPGDLPDWISYVERPDHPRLAADVFNTSRVVVCASRAEGFGLTSLEAMACGCALVTLDTGGSRDFARDGLTALVAEQGDLDGLAANLVAVLRDPALHRRLVTRSVIEVQAFTWDRSVDRLEELLWEYLADTDRFLAGSSPT